MTTGIIGLPRRAGAAPHAATSSAARSAIRAVASAWLVWASVGPRAAFAQDQVRNFSDPILVLNTGGHHAPIRALAFSEDETRLFSGGEDKVVRVWDVASDPPAVAETIRPPMFRGPSGAVHALALAPPDASGRRRLALAGYGFQSGRGDIGIYRYPGEADRPRWEIDRWIPAGVASQGVRAAGHIQLVNDLAFAPGGQLLASASSDGTVRLWDAKGERRGTLAVEPPAAVLRLAFTPDGTQVVTGANDGALRVWDVATQKAVKEAPPPLRNPNDPQGVAINALGVSPDGAWAVIGREDGLLIRYDLRAADFAGSSQLLPREERQSAVEALCFAPDGRLATAIMSRQLRPISARPDPSCDVEIRRMPDGAVIERVLSASNAPANPASYPVRALAFSPKGRYLAIGGGNDQVILVQDRLNPGKGLVTLTGSGSGVWDVGFVEREPAGGGMPDVAYSHEPPPRPRPATYLGFALRERAPVAFPAGRVRGAVATFDRWSVEPTGPFRLEVRRDGRRQFDIDLTSAEGRWWSHTIIPPGPGHARAAVAVACKYGVVVHRLEDGARTRFLDGHNGPVHCLAPSPDGKWLATGSADQTVRLWKLAGCDELAPLGAQFERREGAVFVKSVEPRSFAEAGGFVAGDRVESFHLGGKAVSADEFLAKFATWPPNSWVVLEVRRKPVAGRPDAPAPTAVGTTKRDNPLLSLFVGRDREWVLWMPKGYYDSSVTGDSRYLGWHLNKATIANPAPSDYVPLLTYERALRQPRWAEGNLIDRLLDAADDRPVLAVAPNPPDIVADAPPTVAAVVGAGGGAVRDRDGRPLAAGAALPGRIAIDEGSALAIDWTVAPPAGGRLGPFEVRLDGEAAAPPIVPAIPEGRGAATSPTRLQPGPGFHKLRAEARSETGIARQVYVEVEVVARPKPEPPKIEPPRLIVLAIAPKFDGKAIPQVKFGPTDAEDLARFFGRHAVSEASGVPFAKVEGPKAELIGAGATVEAIERAFAEAARAPVKRGDLMVVIVESHVLTGRRETRIAASGSRAGAPETMIAADALAAQLGSVARRGCKVLVLVDGLHTSAGPGWDPNLTEWARTLRNRETITTFLASSRPTIATYGSNRVFTGAVLDSIARRSQAASPLMTLAEFREVVQEAVSQFSARNQDAACFIPEGIDGRFPLLAPRP